MLRMPEPDAKVLARRAQIADDLRTMLSDENVITEENQRRVYESDGLTAYRELPMIVVLPETTEQVSQVLRYCHDNSVKIVPRGAGTSLSGGALPLADGITLGLGKFKQVLEIDLPNRCAVVQPGETPVVKVPVAKPQRAEAQVQAQSQPAASGSDDERLVADTLADDDDGW